MRKFSFLFVLTVGLMVNQAFGIPPIGSGKIPASRAGSMNNVVNQSANVGNTNIAIGTNSSAHTGSIVNDGGRMNNVVNQSVNAGNINIAAGKNSSAYTGAIMNKGEGKYNVIRQDVNVGNKTIIIGDDATAATGTIIIK